MKRYHISSAGLGPPFPGFATLELARAELQTLKAADLADARRHWSVNASHVKARYTNPERTAYVVELGVNCWSSRAIVKSL